MKDRPKKKQRRQNPDDAWEQLRQIVLQQQPFHQPSAPPVKTKNINHFVEKSASKNIHLTF
jgi:hypothetical protein